MGAILDSSSTDKRLSIHEAVCAERYDNLVSRLGRLEKIAITIAGTLILAMGGAIWQLASVAAKIP